MFLCHHTNFTGQIAVICHASLSLQTISHRAMQFVPNSFVTACFSRMYKSHIFRKNTPLTLLNDSSVVYILHIFNASVLVLLRTGTWEESVARFSYR